MEAWGEVNEARPQGKQRVLCSHLGAALGSFAALIMVRPGVPAVDGRKFFAAVMRLSYVLTCPCVL